MGPLFFFIEQMILSNPAGCHPQHPVTFVRKGWSNKLELLGFPGGLESISQDGQSANPSGCRQAPWHGILA